jgi:ABC-type taurine transport system ATPase subunit
VSLRQNVQKTLFVLEKFKDVRLLEARILAYGGAARRLLKTFDVFPSSRVAQKRESRDVKTNPVEASMPRAVDSEFSGQ